MAEPLGRRGEVVLGVVGESVERRAPRALADAGESEAFEFVDDRGGLCRGIEAALRRGEAGADPRLQLTESAAERLASRAR